MCARALEVQSNVDTTTAALVDLWYAIQALLKGRPGVEQYDGGWSQIRRELETGADTITRLIEYGACSFSAIERRKGRAKAVSLRYFAVSLSLSIPACGTNVSLHLTSLCHHHCALLLLKAPTSVIVARRVHPPNCRSSSSPSWEPMIVCSRPSISAIPAGKPMSPGSAAHWNRRRPSRRKFPKSGITRCHRVL